MSNIRVFCCLLVVQSALTATECIAAVASEPAENLIAAMGSNNNLEEQQKRVTSVIGQFKTNRLIPSKPHRIDYTDHYPLLKPVQILDHDLVILEVETMGTYIGCCVSEGVGMLFRLRASTHKLDSFAKAKGCSVEKFSNPVEYLKRVQMKAPLPLGPYAYVSCRERDATLSR